MSDRFSGIVGGMYHSNLGVMEPVVVKEKIERVFVHATNEIPWQWRYLHAFHKGLKAHGVEMVWEARDKVTGGVSIAFGPNYWKKVIAKTPRDKLITVNRCFLGLVDDHVSIGWGGFNGRATFPESDYSQTRHHLHFLPPMRDPATMLNGGDVLVLGEYNKAPPPNIGTQLRRHPMGTPNPENLPPEGEFEAVAVYGGTTSVVRYIFDGYPVFVHGEENVAKWLVRYDGIFYTEQQRVEWLEQLAWAQWRIDEIESGAFWPHIERARHGL